jgi:phage shock protein A
MAKSNQSGQKDVVTRLAEQGEEAFQRIAEVLGGVRFVEALNGMRDKVDDLSKRVRSLDPLEKRVAELERRLDALSKPARSTPARKTTATRAKSTKSTKGPARKSSS